MRRPRRRTHTHVVMCHRARLTTVVRPVCRPAGQAAASWFMLAVAKRHCDSRAAEQLDSPSGPVDISNARQRMKRARPSRVTRRRRFVILSWRCRRALAGPEARRDCRRRCQIVGTATAGHAGICTCPRRGLMRHTRGRTVKCATPAHSGRAGGHSGRAWRARTRTRSRHTCCAGHLTSAGRPCQSARPQYRSAPATTTTSRCACGLLIRRRASVPPPAASSSQLDPLDSGASPAHPRPAASAAAEAGGYEQIAFLPACVSHGVVAPSSERRRRALHIARPLCDARTTAGRRSSRPARPSHVCARVSIELSRAPRPPAPTEAAGSNWPTLSIQ
jgi:hypothetical protein